MKKSNKYLSVWLATLTAALLLGGCSDGVLFGDPMYISMDVDGKEFRTEVHSTCNPDYPDSSMTFLNNPEENTFTLRVESKTMRKGSKNHWLHIQFYGDSFEVGTTYTLPSDPTQLSKYSTAYIKVYYEDYTDYFYTTDGWFRIDDLEEYIREYDDMASDWQKENHYHKISGEFEFSLRNPSSGKGMTISNGRFVNTLFIDNPNLTEIEF